MYVRSGLQESCREGTIYRFKHREEEKLYNIVLKVLVAKVKVGVKVVTGDKYEIDRRCLSSVMWLAVSSVDHFNRKIFTLSYKKLCINLLFFKPWCWTLCFLRTPRGGGITIIRFSIFQNCFSEPECYNPFFPPTLRFATTGTKPEVSGGGKIALSLITCL